MADNIHIEQASFTPAEVERITGTSGDQQRSLRQHGYLPKGTGGWTRFTLSEVARLLIIEACRNAGVPPATGSLAASANRATNHLLSFAIEMKGAVSGAELLGSRKLLPWSLERDKQRRFLVVYGTSEGAHLFTNDLKKLVYSKDEIGAAILIDLKANASRLVDGAGGPLITISSKFSERGVA
jgi:hypothetical protein